MRSLLLALILLALLQPAPLRLEASTVRSEFVSGDAFTVSAYLFNDGDTPAQGEIRVTAPAGFDRLTAESAAGAIPAGHALQLNSSYRVGSITPGLYSFRVQGGGQIVTVTIRVGPVNAPPARQPGYRVYLPAFR